MAIAFTRYVDITSGVGGNIAVATRQLISRIFTTNDILPPNSFVEFETLEEVGNYFGISSNEYLRAEFYFSFVSKNIHSPQLISFARWVDAAVGSMIFGRKGSYQVSQFTGFVAGQFTLTLGGFTHTLTGIDCSGAASLAAVAADIQTAIRSFSGGGVAWTAATVGFDATRGSFNMVSGTTGDDVVSVAAGPSNDIAGALGWLTGAIYADGSEVESITDTLTASIQASNNFGTFLFMPVLNQSQIVEAATYNATKNNMFMYLVPVTEDNASALSAALITLPGVAMTLAPMSTEYDEMFPGMIEAATDYTARNAVQNYMFQQTTLTPKVMTDEDADLYDGLRVNYYGQTQTAGQFISFYQRGFLTGQATDPTDQNVYANEQWFKDYEGAQLMTLLLSLPRVSANVTGRSQVLSQLQGGINLALLNGTISVGKRLNDTQKQFITQVTGDNKAWYQVQTIGYWVDCQIISFVQNGITQWKAVYTLIYSKDDDIRKVEGTHVLI